MRHLPLTLVGFLTLLWGAVGIVLALAVHPAEAQSSRIQRAPASFSPEERGWSVRSSAALQSSYVFRGQRLFNGLSFQPAVQSHHSLGNDRSIDLLLWAHAPLSADSFVEIDQAVAFNQRYSRATFSVGHQLYYLSDNEAPLEDRGELWAAVALDTMLNPVFSINQDYSRYNLQYYEISLSHTFEKTGEGAFNFTLFSNLGFVSNGVELYSANGLVQVTTGVSTDIVLSSLVVAPRLSFTSAADERTEDTLWAGISVRYGR